MVQMRFAGGGRGREDRSDHRTDDESLVDSAETAEGGVAIALWSSHGEESSPSM